MTDETFADVASVDGANAPTVLHGIPVPHRAERSAHQARSKLGAFVVVILTAGVMAGCGQKGPLKLPSAASAQAAR